MEVLRITVTREPRKQGSQVHVKQRKTEKRNLKTMRNMKGCIDRSIRQIEEKHATAVERTSVWRYTAESIQKMTPDLI